MNNEAPTEVDMVLEEIEKNFPKNADAISTIAFVHWHNILNHAAIEGMDEKQTLFVGTLILTLASSHFKLKNTSLEETIQKIKEVSLSESVDFLSGESDEYSEE